MFDKEDVKTIDLEWHKMMLKKAIEVLRDIGSGPGYPLDHCPKCDATHKALIFINELETSQV